MLPEEAEAAVKIFKNGKSPGEDNMKPEHPRVCVVQSTCRMLSYCIENGKIPDASKELKMILLLEKDNPEDLNN